MSSVCGVPERTWSENTGHKRTSRLVPIFYDMDMKKIEYIHFSPPQIHGKDEEHELWKYFYVPGWNCC